MALTLAGAPGAARLTAVKFRVEVARDPAGVRVSPVGEVDVATIGQIREPIDEALAAGAERVILDLRETTFADSTVLHLAFEVDARAKEQGAAFAIVGGPPAVQRTFDVAGMTPLLPFVDVPRG
jgi:anti-anti-sigma factor